MDWRNHRLLGKSSLDGFDTVIAGQQLSGLSGRVVQPVIVEAHVGLSFVIHESSLKNSLSKRNTHWNINLSAKRVCVVLHIRTEELSIYLIFTGKEHFWTLHIICKLMKYNIKFIRQIIDGSKLDINWCVLGSICVSSNIE